MLHCNASIPNSIRTVSSHLCTTRLASTSSSSSSSSSSLHSCPRQATRHPPWFRRRYATEASLARDTLDNGSALIPQIRTYRNRPSKSLTYKKSHLGLELRWLKDPLKLADHTVSLLREDDVEKALEIVRLASKDVQCTVSWNHLIDYEMSKARVNNALKLYNEASDFLLYCYAYDEG